MQSFINQRRVLLLHLSFWCVYISFSLYQLSQFRHGRGIDWTQGLEYISIQLLFNVSIAYLNYAILLPRFLESKNLWRYFVEFLVPFAFLVTARIYLQRYLVDGLSRQEWFFYSPLFTVQVIFITLFIAIFVGMLRFAKDWFEFEAKKKEIENEKLYAELNFLKAQINPHFLFNTLNNLYYLAYTQSPNTTEVIAKLSQMMRYMIYDSNYPKVQLSKEIEYMENYISLERLRLNNQIPIHFEVTGNPDQFFIVPLIFITFLENAFKHGVSNNQAGCWVNISIDLKGKECCYTVENSKVTATNLVAGNKSGIGLQNVQRRLELSYPNQYTLKIEDLPDRFFVQLNLTLA
ncbi:sensor histidine kinase [Adhaeribacter aquaticus]|uniref:sensor histidine kinase n=1 Tax=Adhaeribacter aquaticus TaxID=299567 RepID=UPI000426D7D5|nr:histidine kinase [Adhaeribacter aquaticus]